MKLISLLLLLLISTIGNCQITKDTIELYNGEHTKKRIERNKDGQIVKEIHFHSNGNIKTEYFFSEKEKVKWIAYDTYGNVISEWRNPEIGYRRIRKIRNIIFSIVPIIILGLIVLSIRTLNYKKTYYLMVLFGVLTLAIMFLFQNKIRDADEIIGLIGASILILIPPTVFLFAIYNLFKRRDIPIIISILLTLVSAILILFLAVAYAVSGAGMIG